MIYFRIFAIPRDPGWKGVNKSIALSEVFWRDMIFHKDNNTGNKRHVQEYTNDTLFDDIWFSGVKTEEGV